MTTVHTLLRTRHFGFSALAAALIVGLAGASLSPVGAGPIDDKRAQAEALQDQIDANRLRFGTLAEQYNRAQLEFEEAERARAQAQQAVDETQARLDTVKDLLNDRAAALYRRASGGGSVSDLDAGDATELLSRRQYAGVQAQRDNDLIDELAGLRRRLARQRDSAEEHRLDAERTQAEIAATKDELAATTAAQEELLRQVQGELAALVQQEQQRRLAEAEAKAKALYGNEPYPNLPPPGPAAAAAIAWGKTQIGKPYVYAASGPNSYDCSGFTMAAFKKAGVSLPHYSGAQWAKLPHVPLTGMMPGDLVFWGANASSHVAIFIGNGLILEAGGTGNNVHIGPIWGNPSGAARVV